MTYVNVNACVKRCHDFGIEGLQNQPDQGHKRILNKETNKESILKGIKANCRRIQTAKAEWEKESVRSVSLNRLNIPMKLSRYQRFKY